MPAYEVHHTSTDVEDLIHRLNSLKGDTKVVMEHTGRYYESLAFQLTKAGIFVSAVNPLLIKNFGTTSLRAPKTDKADAMKIARYTLDNWVNVKQ